MSVPLGIYLEERNESQASFARRSKVPQQTLVGVVQGHGCHCSTAYLIVEACRDRPLSRGRTVEFVDLVPLDVLRPADRRRRERAAARRDNGRDTERAAAAAK